MEITLKYETGANSQLQYNARRLKRFSPLTPSVVSITRHFIPERRRVEDFIAAIYSANYDASIEQHYPTLMSIRDQNDTILGALGFRRAAEENLFLEHYIDTPIETEMRKAYDAPIDRNSIIEVGNLASKGEGATIFLMPALLAHLKHQGYRYVTFTATSSLYGYLRKIGVNPQVIAQVDQERLPDGGTSWGHYYDCNPRVIAGDICFAAQRLQRFLGIELHTFNTGLYSRLHPEPVVD